MENLRLEEISMFWLLALPIAIFLLLRWGRHLQIKNFSSFLDKGLIETLIPGYAHLGSRYGRFVLIFSIAILFICLCLLRPQWGFTWRESKARGVDIVVAIDVSDSMLAQDVQPNRLTRAKREIVDLLNKLKGDRVALVTFAGTAYLESPLTLDYGAFRSFLEAIDIDLIPIKGTNIEAALEVSLQAFYKGLKGADNKINNRDRALLLITDGEDFEGNFSTIASKAKAKDVHVYVIGVGTESGAPIPTSKGYKKDASGEVVISKLNEDALQQIAKETGGKYALSINSEQDAYQLYDKGIRANLDSSSLLSSKSRKWNEYFQLPLLLGLICILLAWNSQYLRFFFGIVLLAHCSLANCEAQAAGESEIPAQDSNSQSNKKKETLGAIGRLAFERGDFDKAISAFTEGKQIAVQDYRFHIGLGASLYRTEQFKEAGRAFLEAALATKKNKEKANALYNAGNSLVQIGDYEGAIQAYTEALKYDSKDDEIKSNLKYTKQILKEEQKKQEQKEKQEQNKQQDQNQQNKGEQQKEQQQQKEEQEQEQEQQQEQRQEKEQEQEQEEQQQQEQEQEQEKEKEEQEQEKEEQEQEQEKSEQQKEEQEQEKEEQSKEGEAEKEKTEEEKQKEMEELLKSTPSEEGKEQPEEERTEGTLFKDEEEKSEKEDQLEAQLGNIEESLSRRMKYRMRKGIEQLREMNRRTPEKDW